MAQFDHIVVGGGSAGCLIAARLSEDPRCRVLLLESGDWDRSPWFHIPATFFRVNRNSRYMTRYLGEPQTELGGRPYLLPQGHVIGGGSSVNAMLYVRGQAEDYADWAQMGCTGWSYEDVLPVFRALESNDTHRDDFHGIDGALSVSAPRHRHPLCEAFLQAAREAGLPENPDFNGVRQEGMGFYQTTTRNGRRWSSAQAFLKPARARQNLEIRTGARVARVLIEDGRATGVVLTSGERIDAQGEVVLTAGTLATPAILMRSGIGPGQHLQDLGIEVYQDLPGVGENFQDHVAVPLEARLKDPISVFGQDRGLRAARNMALYLTTRRGLLSSNVLECGGFIDTAGTGRPDIQYHFMPGFSLASDGTREFGHGFGFSACVLRPQSRGSLRLRDRTDGIVLNANVLSAQADRLAMLRGLRLGLKILEAPALQKLIETRTSPKGGTTDDDLVAHIRAQAKTVFHPVGTCRMGPASDTGAVVDPHLKVRGIRSLRIADASVMPSIVSGNTNAPTMMIAERAARFMRASTSA